MFPGFYAILGIPSLLKQIYLMLSYVSNLNSFPKPLSQEDEKYYIRKMREGDAAARNTLIEHNMRLVAHVAKKYIATGRETDDIISIGTIGLIKGVSSFDETKGTKLATYAARCIENEILMVIRSSKKMQNEVSIEEPIGVDREGNSITFNDILSRDDDEVIDAVSFSIQMKKLHGVMKEVLTPREGKVIKMRFGLEDGREYTQMEISKKLEISRSYVSRIEKKAIKKLKKYIYND